MSRWFRFYNDAFRNPKVAKLTDSQLRLWMELLCVASEHDGLIPPLEDLKHLLKRRLDHLSRGLDELLKAGLIDIRGGGFEPHKWDKFQYKSDSSAERVRKHRNSPRNVTVTTPDTETDADTDAEYPPSQESGGSGVEIAREPFRVIGGGK